METLKQEEARLGALIQAGTESPDQGAHFDWIHEQLAAVGGCWTCAEAGDGSRCMNCISDDPEGL